MKASNATLEGSRTAGRRAMMTPAGLDDAAKQQIFGRHRRGVGLDVLAAEHSLTRTGVNRVVNEMRATRLLEGRIEAMPHESFDDPAQQVAILGPMPESPGGDGASARQPHAPEGLPPYLASLYDVPLLNRDQEMHLFRKMNYLKYQAIRLREKLDPAHAKAADMDRIERLQEDALAVKNQIIRANLRLVVSIAKKNVGQADNLFERVSDGNMSLIRAVEKFDYSRGNKFSTYASWAIIRNFARSIRDENHRRDRFVTGHEVAFESAADPREQARESEAEHNHSREAVRGMLGRLDERERKILSSRFGIGDSGERTLEDLGRELGITKERVRQIEARAQDKLRKIAVEERLDLMVS